MQLTTFLKHLVGFHSVSNDLVGTEECFRYLRKHLTACGLDVQLLRHNDFPSLVVSTLGNKKPRVLLQAHIDVVPGRDELFELKEKEGRLYGRGVYDMKFAAACYLQLGEDLKDSLKDYDFGMMFTSDEEIGGRNGVKHLLEQGYGGDFCILPDAGDNFQIQSGCNGVWIVRLAADGLSAHGSRPWEGDNAIKRLMECLSDINELFGEPAMSKSSLTISKIEGGKVVNQVPDNANACLDMRFTSNQERTEKQKELEKIAAKHKISVETLEDHDCLKTDLEDPHIKEFRSMAERILGRPVGTVHAFGASDARYFVKHGISTLLIRPTGGSAHADDEWIDKADLLVFYEVLKEYVTKAAKIS
jgi:succinyl-diaminopimelate desuccinylase